MIDASSDMKHLLPLIAVIFALTTVHADEDSEAVAEKAISGADFAGKAAASGAAEIALGKLGAEKGSSSRVRAFGEKMVADHTRANRDLKELAAGKNIDLPAAPSGKSKQALSRLEKLEGEEFDRAFAGQMVEDHERAVLLFRRAATACTDEDLKSFAVQTLPLLERHLAEARALKAGLD